MLAGFGFGPSTANVCAPGALGGDIDPALPDAAISDDRAAEVEAEAEAESEGDGGRGAPIEPSLFPAVSLEDWWSINSAWVEAVSMLWGRQTGSMQIAQSQGKRDNAVS